MNREFRARVAKVELRDVSKEEKDAGYIGAITGEIPYESDSEVLYDREHKGGFIERLARGAFKGTIDAKGDVLAFAGHTDDPLSAFARSGVNLTLTDGADALQWRALIPDTRAGSDLLTNVKHGIIRGTSFEFSIRENGQKWEKRGNVDVRTVTAAELYTVNPVANPAYPGSTLEERQRMGRSYVAYDSCDYKWSDPSMTCHCAYALSQLGVEMGEMQSALVYLRENPDGPLAKYAKDELAESQVAIAKLTKFLAENGTELDEDFAERSKKLDAESRALLDKKNISPSADDWEQRQIEAIKLAPVNQDILEVLIK